MQVSAILDNIDRGGLSLPMFQRGYVWTRPQVKKLMQSLYRGYPVGGCVASSIGCSFSEVGLLLQNHYPRFTGAPPCRFRTLTRRPPSVDSGLGGTIQQRGKLWRTKKRMIGGRELSKHLGN